MPAIEVKDQGLLVDRGVGGPQGLWLSSVVELAAIIKAWADAANGGSQVLDAANAAVLVPIVPAANAVMNTGWCYNGGTATGNVDIGLYDRDFNLLTSTGAFAQSGTATPQTKALATPFQVRAGVPYYLALSASSGTTTFECLDTGAITVARTLGICKAAAAHPLPATVTPANFASRYLPAFGLTYRTAGL